MMKHHIKTNKNIAYDCIGQTIACITRSVEYTAQSLYHIGTSSEKKSNVNKCFEIQLKLHDISWWFVRIFMHVRWAMASISSLPRREKKNVWNYGDCICEMAFLQLTFFFCVFSQNITHNPIASALTVDSRGFWHSMAILALVMSFV